MRKYYWHADSHDGSNRAVIANLGAAGQGDSELTSSPNEKLTAPIQLLVYMLNMKRAMTFIVDENTQVSSSCLCSLLLGLIIYSISWQSQRGHLICLILVILMRAVNSGLVVVRKKRDDGSNIYMKH